MMSRGMSKSGHLKRFSMRRCFGHPAKSARFESAGDKYVQLGTYVIEPAGGLMAGVEPEIFAH
ncbi:hypothetical protein KC19_VG333100 [Ceratodon purpureus]|uniref:Uncharacterized protein n=1 Tax=Ceratodon purpureus TaxID=3225 RepID=A0A8T0HW16_CERPU|nr:hypothetical protein KC19_VG333100 [Ceratodon purpureus]